MDRERIVSRREFLKLTGGVVAVTAAATSGATAIARLLGDKVESRVPGNLEAAKILVNFPDVVIEDYFLQQAMTLDAMFAGRDPGADIGFHNVFSLYRGPQGYLLTIKDIELNPQTSEAVYGLSQLKQFGTLSVTDAMRRVRTLVRRHNEFSSLELCSIMVSLGADSVREFAERKAELDLESDVGPLVIQWLENYQRIHLILQAQRVDAADLTSGGYMHFGLGLILAENRVVENSHYELAFKMNTDIGEVHVIVRGGVEEEEFIPIEVRIEELASHIVSGGHLVYGIIGGPHILPYSGLPTSIQEKAGIFERAYDEYTRDFFEELKR